MYTLEVKTVRPRQVALRLSYRLTEQETRERLTAWAFFEGVKIGQYRWQTDDVAALADWAEIPHSLGLYSLIAYAIPLEVPAPWWDFGPQPFHSPASR